MSLLLMNDFLKYWGFLNILLRLLLLVNEKALFHGISFLLISDSSLLLSPSCSFLSFLS